MKTERPVYRPACLLLPKLGKTELQELLAAPRCGGGVTEQDTNHHFARNDATK